MDRERAVARVLAYLEQTHGMILGPIAAQEILVALDRDDAPPDTFDLRNDGQHIVIQAADLRRLIR